MSITDIFTKKGKGEGIHWSTKLFLASIIALPFLYFCASKLENYEKQLKPQVRIAKVESRLEKERRERQQKYQQIESYKSKKEKLKIFKTNDTDLLFEPLYKINSTLEPNFIIYNGKRVDVATALSEELKNKEISDLEKLVKNSDLNMLCDCSLERVWKKKIMKLDKRKRKEASRVWKRARNSKLTKMSLEEYRNRINYIIKEAREELEPYLKRKEKERRTLLSGFLDNITPNVITALNVEELMPRKIKEKDFSSGLRVWLFIQLLQQKGLEQFVYWPSLHDNLYSYGVGQFTSKVASSLQGRYNLKKFDEWNFEEQIKAIYFLAYDNLSRLFNKMPKGYVKKWNKILEKAKKDEGARKNFIALFAGLIDYLHHNPRGITTYELCCFADYAKKHNYRVDVAKFYNFYIKKKRNSGYFLRTAKNYFVLKVAHKIFN